MKFIGFIGAAGLLVACDATFGTGLGMKSSTTTTTSAAVPAVTNERAIEEITNARCARAFSCDNIGAGRVWHDYDACTRDSRLAMRDMLVGQMCTDGVNSAELASCLSEMRNAQCTQPQGAAEHFEACANAKLCR